MDQDNDPCKEQNGDLHKNIHAVDKTKSSASALVISASDKAGMDGVDRARIDQIILRESGDSAFMKQQRKRDQNVNDKIAQMQAKLRDHNRRPAWRATIERELEPIVKSLKMRIRRQQRHSTCVVVDMDMFYMACELLTRPELTKVPACVGTGMILTSNYCARQYGVRSAMAGWIGDKLVEELSEGKQRLIHIPPHFPLYSEKSKQVQQVLAEYDPHLRAYSLDEAYLRLGPYLVLHLEHPNWSHEQIRDALQRQAEGPSRPEILSEKATLDVDPVDENEDMEEPSDVCVDDTLSMFPSHVVLDAACKVVADMRSRVRKVTGGLTCSAGLASNFMLAKIGSDRNKPNGQMVVGPSHEDDILPFLHPLPIRKIPGIGRVTEKILLAFDISTVKDILEQRALVRLLFTPATWRFLLRASLGCDGESSNDNTIDENDMVDDNQGHSKTTSTTATSNDASQKGISKERTFSSGRPWSEIMSRLEDIARGLSADMVRKNLRSQTLTVKAKLHTFDVLSRSRTVRGMCLQAPDAMVQLATELLMELKKQHAPHRSIFSVRLLGIRCSNFRTMEEGDDGIGVGGRQTTLGTLFSGSPPVTENGKMTVLQNQIPTLSSSSKVGLIDPSLRNQENIQEATIELNDGPLTPKLHCGEPIAAPSASQNRYNHAIVGRLRTVTAPISTNVIKNNNNSNNSCSRNDLKQVHCPMCQQRLFQHDNDALNRHIDTCLSSSMVRKAVREESLTAKEGPRNKKCRLTDFFRDVTRL